MRHSNGNSVGETLPTYVRDTFLAAPLAGQRSPAGCDHQRRLCQNFAELDSCLPVFSAMAMQEATCCCSWPAINPIASALSRRVFSKACGDALSSRRDACELQCHSTCRASLQALENACKALALPDLLATIEIARQRIRKHSAASERQCEPCGAGECRDSRCLQSSSRSSLNACPKSRPRIRSHVFPDVLPSEARRSSTIHHS